MLVRTFNQIPIGSIFRFARLPSRYQKPVVKIDHETWVLINNDGDFVEAGKVLNRYQDSSYRIDGTDPDYDKYTSQALQYIQQRNLERKQRRFQ